MPDKLSHQPEKILMIFFWWLNQSSLCAFLYSACELNCHRSKQTRTRSVLIQNVEKVNVYRIFFQLQNNITVQLTCNMNSVLIHVRTVSCPVGILLHRIFHVCTIITLTKIIIIFECCRSIDSITSKYTTCCKHACLLLAHSLSYTHTEKEMR